MENAEITAISRHAFDSEEACAKRLLKSTGDIESLSDVAFERAESYVNFLRDNQDNSLLEHFLKQYDLKSEEGRAMMSLAEALLRIPDNTTTDALIRDKFAQTEWVSHLGQSDSGIINASTHGLRIASVVSRLGAQESTVSNVLGTMASKMSEPFIRTIMRRAMRFIGREFVLGQTIERAMEKAAEYEKDGFLFSYDMLGEGARSDAQAEEFFNSYISAIERISNNSNKEISLFDRPGISVKISALHPHYELLNLENLRQELLPRLLEIVNCGRKNGVSVIIDAEEMRRLDLSLILFQELLQNKDLQDLNGIGLAVQAYSKCASYVIDFIIDLAQKTGRKIPVRLVKGAYWDAEIKHAQLAGVPDFPVFTQKYHTDISYLVCAQRLLANTNHIYPQFGTHNAFSIAVIIEIAAAKNCSRNDYEFQRLFGMGRQLYAHITKQEDIKCRIYAPVGPHNELLSYLIRRLLENGANNSFVHQFPDKDITTAELMADPFKLASDNDYAPARHIKPPSDIYANRRKNSQGFDLGNISNFNWLTQGIKSRLRDDLLAIPHKNTDDCDEAIENAYKAFPEWSGTDINHRIKILNHLADLYEENRDTLITLCIKEAGKTLADSIAEVREAVDFCRYYALEAEKLFKNPQEFHGATGETNQLTMHGRGVFACISPWNFPLAIFTGQVVAALVTGNCVIAKPAEQTPAIAALAVDLMYQAGVPKDVLHLITGQGKIVGNHIINDERIAGVCFTGSTATAHHINRTLAARNAPIAPLIAETGGQNCMIVDSSALPEQTIDDIIDSAFGSAGQRCSALRVCYLQEEIADDFIELLAGAMQELHVGHPSDFATDIGPVIDEDAKQKLDNHIEKMRQEARFIASTPLPSLTGNFVTPHAFEIGSISQLEGEVFGPVLHIIRYKSGDLGKVIDEVNFTGFGLTSGIQSRIESRIDYISQHIKAGNIYVNRPMTGAIVGVQPFGGEALSGTGPKAGGPHYLLRFCTERCVTTNITAIGGNLELLSGNS